LGRCCETLTGSNHEKEAKILNDKDNNVELNLLEKQIKEIEEWQKNANNPGHFVGTGKIPIPLRNLLGSPRTMLIVGIHQEFLRMQLK